MDLILAEGRQPIRILLSLASNWFPFIYCFDIPYMQELSIGWRSRSFLIRVLLGSSSGRVGVGRGISCVWFQSGLVSIVVRGAKVGRSVYSTMSL